jgi:hypothetical protein
MGGKGRILRSGLLRVWPSQTLEPSESAKNEWTGREHDMKRVRRNPDMRLTKMHETSSSAKYRGFATTRHRGINVRPFRR